MYIFSCLAENNGMENVIVYGAFVGALILLFPIFISMDAYVNPLQGKLFFVLRLFGLLPVFGGYMTVEKEGIAMHISEKKAILFPYKDMGKERKKFEITAGFQTYTFKSTVEIGFEDFPFAAFSAAALLQTLSAAIFPVLKRRKPFLTLKNSVFLSENAHGVRITAHLITVFNQLTVIIAIIKIILEEMIQLWQAKKNTRPLKA